jgi:hypothetical protein
MKNTLSKAYEEYALAKSNAVLTIKAQLIQGIQKILEEYDAESISWNQYTPYFNDGDRCEFETDICCADIVTNNNRSKVIQAELDDLISPIDDISLLEDMFGSEVEVTVLKTGEVIIEDYSDHD